MLAAARLVGFAFLAHETLSPSDLTWFGTPGQTAVVKALASALASVTKRAAMFARQAGAMHAQQQQQQPAAGSEALSAFCFPAALKAVRHDMLGEAVLGVKLAAREYVGEMYRPLDSSGAASSSSLLKQRSSVVLLAVLAVRSLLALADAMEAAAAAAGMTAAQLYARCVEARSHEVF
jgi:hypothetical protein